ncbi:GMC family oxidoreductase [Sphingomonas sp. CGMCC 1.13654]|uniref:GMC family oxidoreductase n=1 Tax=Sphingomonas chungangi TaxID=2683589 RepID=A0A838L9M0_9SPHN|nr:GMC oxidoreductase [Sphingomonas chungangi]MBA2935961.1 GMC family oxidoreductase [Sphingomonas chungangi]MVW55351.1 FAD-dependent oxidoreductase [Sphingomonas chungangi]
MLTDGIAGLEAAGHDLCIVGSGPVGLAIATDLARRGRRVLLLESGGDAADAQVQSLAAAGFTDARRHDDMSIATARRLGGTSNLWGARCLPFDPIDFEARDWVEARWPISHADYVPWIAPAVEATRSGAPFYREPIPGVALADDGFDCTTLERWANRQQAQIIHAEAIARDPKLDVRTHATLVDIAFAESGAVTHITVAHTKSGERVRLPVSMLVIAAGGVESARLLLAAQQQSPGRFGGEDGPLGRYYMGHVLGEIADIVLDGDLDRNFGFHVDAHGSYVRRRFTASAETQRAHRLLNTALWPIVPPISDPRHGSAILSLVYLAMSVGPLGRRLVAEAIRKLHVPAGPKRRLPHIANLATGMPAAAIFGVDFLRRRYDKSTRLPGFFVLNKAHRYGLQYHAEQAPRADSRVRLSGERDRLGLPSLHIDYRFCEQDADSVVRMHDLLEDWLVRSRIGRLEYRVPREARAARVLETAAHGTHQIGLVRMGANRSEGVVDGDLRCFDAPNLFVASTAVLPTSSQANPTLSAVALGLRLADRLAAEASRPLEVVGA